MSVTVWALAAAMVLLPTTGVQAQQRPIFHTFMSPPSTPRPVAETEAVTEVAPDPNDPEAMARAAVAAQAAALREAAHGFPITINAIGLAGRGAVILDTTRLRSEAGGDFLPSAIPARGEAFFGSGNRATVQGAGNAVGFSWAADTGADSQVRGGVGLVTRSATQGDFRLTVPQAYLQWNYLTFGLTDTSFTDMDAIPDTIDLGGPNGRPWIKDNQAQIRFQYLRQADNDPDGVGFSGDVGVEAPGVGVFTRSNEGQPGYDTFSRYPDFVTTLKYRDGKNLKNWCTGEDEYLEYWHLKVASVVRDLGVETSNDSMREHTTGWGVGLSGRYTIFRDRDPRDRLQDYAFFSVTGGRGIAHYFNDLSLVAAVNDAVYDSNTGTLTALPVFGYFAGYQHDWTDCLRSTAVYSHLELDSQNLPGDSYLPYRRGEYMSLNLMYHLENCDTVEGAHPEHNKKVLNNFFVGVEYLYGQKENLGGNWGADQRIEFVVAATK